MDIRKEAWFGNMQVIQKYYSTLNRLTKKDESLKRSHSIDTVDEMSNIKRECEEDIKETLLKKKN